MTTIKDKFCIAVNDGEYDVEFDCKINSYVLSDFRILYIDGQAPRVDQYFLVDEIMDKLERGDFDELIVSHKF